MLSLKWQVSLYSAVHGLLSCVVMARSVVHPPCASMFIVAVLTQWWSDEEEGYWVLQWWSDEEGGYWVLTQWWSDEEEGYWGTDPVVV